MRHGAPATLDHAGIAARIPHSGTMCLLDALLGWTPEQIDCRITGHAEPANPLRLDGRLPAAAALEYASQATALHGALCAPPDGAPQPGFLASARELRLHVARLDDRAGPLALQARRVAGGDGQAMYAFALRDAQGEALADGRLTVVFGRALAAPA
ncbi:MAG: hydroxymyristoyl-ACP dehydratase [Burkholderiaceae bacterium]